MDAKALQELKSDAKGLTYGEEWGLSAYRAFAYKVIELIEAHEDQTKLLAERDENIEGAWNKIIALQKIINDANSDHGAFFAKMRAEIEAKRKADGA